ncbi:MAG: KOW domain-containing RNA-binding protein [Eubacteriales bacterium]
MEVSKANLVISLAGRDKGQLFYVHHIDGQFAFLVNGKGRKLENPKRKKLIHVQKISWTDTRIAERIRSGSNVLNSELRRDLAVIGQQFKSHNQGG